MPLKLLHCQDADSVEEDLNLDVDYLFMNTKKFWWTQRTHVGPYNQRAPGLDEALFCDLTFERFIANILLYKRSENFICRSHSFSKPTVAYMSCRIDIVLLHIFLLISSGIRIGSGTGVNVTTLSEYALGGRKYSTYKLTTSLLASLASGSYFFLLVEQTYLHGFFVLAALLLMPVSLLLTGLLAPRMQAFLKYLSVAEAMGQIYGVHVRMLVALGQVFVKVGYIAMQFSIITKVLESVLPAHHVRNVMVVIVMTVIYSSFRGVRTVTATGLIQLVTFSVVLPILALRIWHDTGIGSHAVTLWSSHPNFNLHNVFSGTPTSWAAINLMVQCALPMVYTPEVFQRMVMARDPRQAKHALCYASFFLMVLFLLVAGIGLLMLTAHPTPPSEGIVTYMIKHCTSAGLRGLLCIGLLALATSTADVLLNTCAVLCANDVARPAYRQQTGSAAAARAFSFVLGWIAFLMSLELHNFLDVIVTTGRYYLPVFPIPFILAVLGFRTSTRVVLASMTSGLVGMMLWSHYVDASTSLIPGLLAHLTVLFGAHYLLGEPGGWVGVRVMPLQTPKKRFSPKRIK